MVMIVPKSIFDVIAHVILKEVYKYKQLGFCDWCDRVLLISPLLVLSFMK